MSSKIIAAVIAGFLMLASVSGQDAGIRGIVLETDSRGNIMPIHGATVHWLATSTGTVTDSAGTFSLPRAESTKRLVVSYVGYKSDTILIADKKFVKLVMINKNMLDEVQVTYERKSTEISFLDPWKTSIMSEKELLKAACCNLAESFETNPSVDVAFTDAISGARQIQMLGLASQYTQVTQEYMPSVRGFATNYGFSYTPGTWLNSIQVTKGVGSVVNGFESISGQINTELHKSDVKENLYFNAYGSEGGRYETNLNLAQAVTPSFSHSILTHGSIINARMDNNNDGYLDNPLGYQWNLMYRWKWDNHKGFVLQGGLRALRDEKTSGMKDFDGQNDTSPASPLYGGKMDANRAEGFLKIGYVFPKKIYKSIGFQLSGVRQDYNSYFGLNTWSGKQRSAYSNLIYQSIIGSTDHKFKTGISNQYDRMREQLFNYSAYTFNREEVVTGAFFEYTYSYLTAFSFVAGLRADYNNLYGAFLTPRIHARYALDSRSVLRFSAGRGQRTANVIAENLGLLASSRRFVFMNDPSVPGYGFKPEVAWNYGLNFTHDFKLNYRKGTFSADYYFTDFSDQLIVDREATPREVSFYNLRGRSLSHSMQLQVDYEPVKRLDIRLAYRFYDVRTQYTTGYLQAPLVARQRAFANVAYTTKSKWNIDATWQGNGPKRLPDTRLNPEAQQLSAYSPFFSIVNAQVTKTITKIRLDLYAGMENIFDFKQQSPIIDAQNPFGSYFDAGMIWGPVFGRMVYAGVRLKM